MEDTTFTGKGGGLSDMFFIVSLLFNYFNLHFYRKMVSIAKRHVSEEPQTKVQFVVLYQIFFSRKDLKIAEIIVLYQLLKSPENFGE